jgi:hypothetical protein
VQVLIALWQRNSITCFCKVSANIRIHPGSLDLTYDSLPPPLSLSLSRTQTHTHTHTQRTLWVRASLILRYERLNMNSPPPPKKKECVCVFWSFVPSSQNLTHILCSFRYFPDELHSPSVQRKSWSAPARTAAACSGAGAEAPSKSMNLFFLHSASLQVFSLSCFPTCFTISNSENHGHKIVWVCSYSHINSSKAVLQSLQQCSRGLRSSVIWHYVNR